MNNSTFQNSRIILLKDIFIKFKHDFKEAKLELQPSNPLINSMPNQGRGRICWVAVHLMDHPLQLGVSEFTWDLGCQQSPGERCQKVFFHQPV